MDADTHGLPPVELRAVFGFNGSVRSGLSVHPDGEHLIYPLGSTVVLRTIKDGRQELLQGHTSDVSCVSVSRSGSLIASGQVDCMGFKAVIIIWDYPQRRSSAQLLLHEAKVEALDFSPDEKYLVSLGGQDDGRVVVWNVETRQAVCGSAASGRSTSPCLTVRYSNTNSNLFVTAGSSALRVWELDPLNRKIQPTECQTGILKRAVECIEISEDDEFVFCGTTSGDIMKFNLKTRRLSDYGPKRFSAKHSRSVSALRTLKGGHLLVGSGCGKLMLCSASSFQALKEAQLEKAVTSIALSGEGQQFFVGTEAAQMYGFRSEDFRAELISSSHRSAVKDVAICFGTSELFATCSEEDIRVWHIDKPKELLRITVPNMTCNALDFMSDGHSIISAWNDGKVRVFAPESGRLVLIIHDAHNTGVTAIAGTRNCKRIISGGGKGMVRVWELQPKGHRLLETMKEHRGAVTCIKIKSDDKECVSASSDGACIIWDLVRFVSLKMVITTRLFRAVCYHPDIYQIITSGTDRKIELPVSGFASLNPSSPSRAAASLPAESSALRVWELDPLNRKIQPTECQTGILKRAVECIEISEDDEFVFCGTTSGDIMKFNLKTRRLSDYGPKRFSAKHSRSVSALRTLKGGHLLVGSGCGKLMLCSASSFQALKEAQLEKAVTSIALSGEGQQFFVGTEAAQMYGFRSEDFRAELISSSHRSAVKDVAICFGTSELFATCSEEDIRVWHIDKPKELLRITVPNMTCNALDFMSDGHSIISAWNDGKVRVFAPESGRLVLIIHDAHNTGVTAIAGTRNCKRIISGGGKGMVRVWELQPKGHRLLETMKEHRGAVTCIKIKSDDKECVSASSDGACIIWDLVRFVSLKMVITTRLFRAVCYHPDIYQIITSGTDRKVVYWDAYDGSAIRELEGLLTGSINAMDISQSGTHFVTGGDDKLVKVWDYMEGAVTHVGMAHGGSITGIKLCSNSSTLISTSADGAVVLWRFPHSPAS